MFIQLATDTLDALINLNHAPSITVRPYKAGYQLVAVFPENWKPLIVSEMRPEMLSLGEAHSSPKKSPMLNGVKLRVKSRGNCQWMDPGPTC